MPATASGPANPTGIVFNNGTDVVLARNGKSGVAAFLYMTHAFTVVDSSASGAVYKGMAIVLTSAGHRSAFRRSA